MKLVASIAASLALAKAQETDMADMEMPENMEIEQPWYTFMEPFVQVEDSEEKIIFKVEEPSMYLLKQKDGNKMNLKTPWYNRKYEIKPKANSFEFQFKETIPGMSVLNEMNFKTSNFPKNVKTTDENGETVKTPVGVQNKFVMLGKHQNEGAKFKVENKHNYIHDMEGRPMTFTHKSSWDHKFNVEGAQAAMEFMMNQDMMEDLMGEEMEDMDMQAMEGMWNPNAEKFDAWFTKGGTNMDAEWSYDDNMEWQSFEWSFRNYADSYGDSPDGDWDIQAQGSTEIINKMYNEQANTWHAEYAYESSCNQGWTNNGQVVEHVENLDQCMEMFEAFYNMDFEAIFTEYLDNPCVMSFEVEGSVTSADAETGAMVENSYKQGMKFTVSSIMNHALEAYMLGNEEILAGIEAAFAPIVSVSTEVVPVGVTEGAETSTTFGFMGQPQITLTWERLQAAHQYNQEMWSRAMFNMYKKGEHLVNKMMMKDWESEDFKEELTAGLFNIDYVVDKIGAKQQEMVQALQTMECAYPHWDGMSGMGITIHDAVQMKMYAKMSEHVQMMALADQLRYWDYVKLSQYFYSTDGSMDWKEIQFNLWSRSPAEQFQWAADMTNDMDGTIVPPLVIEYADPKFMYYWIGQEMPAEMTDEDWEFIAEAFKNSLPSYEDLIQIAETIRAFEPVEMSYEDIDAGMAAICNAQFNMLLNFHSELFNNKVEFIQNAKQTALYWSQKHVEWLSIPRAEVEAEFDSCYDEVEALKEEGALWDCEYQVFAAPGFSRKYYSELDEACQAQMQEKYPGIESWEFDGVMEGEEDEFMMDA